MEKFQGIHVAVPGGPVDGIGSTLCRNQGGVTLPEWRDLNARRSDTLYSPSSVTANSTEAPSMRNNPLSPISFIFA